MWLGSACQPLPKLMHKLLSRTGTVITVIKDFVFSIVVFGLCLSQLLAAPEHSRLLTHTVHYAALNSYYYTL